MGKFVRVAVTNMKLKIPYEQIPDPKVTDLRRIASLCFRSFQFTVTLTRRAACSTGRNGAPPCLLRVDMTSMYLLSGAPL